MSTFDHLPRARQDAICDWLMAHHGWSTDRAMAVLRDIDHVGLYNIGADMQEARRQAERREYDPMADMFRIRS